MSSLRISLRMLLTLPLLASLLVLSPPAIAIPGELDVSFGVGGWVVTELGNRGLTNVSAVAMQSDGKIVVAGSALNRFAVVRYLPDGTQDPAFGENGKVTTSFEEAPSGALALTLQADGKMVVAGYAGGPYDRSVRMAVARYLADGTLDPDFGGGDGRVVVPSINGVAFAAHVVADGGIVLGGCSGCSRRRPVELVRLTPQGVLDPDFGNDGELRVPGRGRVDDFVFDDERVVAVTHHSGRLKLLRFDLDGSLDATFGGDGIRTYSLGGVGNLRATLDASGRIVIVVGRSVFRRAVVLRLTRMGRWDTSFSDDGVAQVGVALEHACDVLVDADGDILIGGGIWAGGGSGEDHSLLARFAEDGTLDASFGDQGIVEQPGPAGIDLTNGCDDLAIQQDGKIVLVTSYLSGFRGRPIMVARFLAA